MMHERSRLNPKDVYTPDDFLAERMLDYERDEAMTERPRVSPDLLLGVVVGATIMLPVYMLVFAFISWLI